MNRIRKITDRCDDKVAAKGSSSSQGPNEIFYHEIAHLTKLRSRPHELLSKDMPGRSRLPVSTMKMLVGREGNYSGRGRFSSADSCHVLSRYLPVNGPCTVDQLDSGIYVSRFSDDGTLFVAGCQGSHIRIYNVDNGWKIKKDILAKSLRWTITDACLSPNQRYLVYASLSPVVHIVNIESAATESLANVSEIHDGLSFSSNNDDYDDFGIFSQIAAASEFLHISLMLTLYVLGDEAGHLLFSGSDDNLCKVWDRRCFISKGKAAGDQTTKLWDIRKMSSNAKEYTPKRRYSDWDYRWDEYPPHAKTLKHPRDQSLITYRGHSILRTLIRCYFSPEYSTGQKYIYTGSSDCSVYIYDLVSGALVATLDHHEGLVRDCSWHPLYPMLVSSSWDCVIARWEFPGRGEAPAPSR
ncbi:DDB1- AND CUL4-ASSOCIATED FACTOR 11 [Salix purpurea]|uniref:DDB1- AND CUL4-ASSOCIATED FACTOR 11 n=1 Tax=Salix purpurea TaxID=77065 RepID=A0A9Q0Z8P3_SALPP|nr:DDB1- AND CUL4-ASSOCIATED FACTOR 11 [Salix purpurea]